MGYLSPGDIWVFLWFYCGLCLYTSGSSCHLVFIWKPACHRWELSNMLLSAVLTHFLSCTTDFSYFCHPGKRLLFTHRKYNSSIWSKLYFKSLLFLFQKSCITVLSLNKVYGPINFKLLLLVPILSVLKDVGPGYSYPKCNFISQWRIMLCLYAWHLQKVTISLCFSCWKRRKNIWEGQMFPRASPFPATEWLFCIAGGSRNAAELSPGWTSHLLITLLQVKVKMSSSHQRLIP